MTLLFRNVMPSLYHRQLFATAADWKDIAAQYFTGAVW